MGGAMRFADDAFGRLGMTEATRAPLRAALAARRGLILVAGPDGSGRSATLDAALGEAPEAMIVGEICDRAGAEAAVRAASSRLVLAAIQAGHAVGAISRLREYRIDPLIIAAGLRLAIAQRLARRLCPECREPQQADGNVSALLGFDPGTFVYVPRGCRGCRGCAGSGYRGRIGLFEALPVEGAIRRLIGMDGDEAVIASHAFRDRPSLSGAARAMVRQGLIAAEEAVFLSRTPMRELV
jgi:general secretion pathway protein E